ncbi:DUF5701 family protein [Mycobacterium sp. JS623]|uniref:DUF5701 family protein n=1 Tax=Mycobacterium sp. JS623 TaxID=212767 RepID=UPI0009FF1962|nr:DUF5701 family protein [Mycobacterium sp. JS623]
MAIAGQACVVCVSCAVRSCSRVDAGITAATQRQTRFRGGRHDRSCRRKPDGSLDARTPALWISDGTDRDGLANRNASKVRCCWADNRHTWLRFASASGRFSVD